MKLSQKRNYVIYGIIIVVLLVVLLVFIHNSKKDKQVTKYTNIFKYAITLESEEEVYAPAQATFGMSMEELLQSHNLDNATVRDEEVQQVIYTTQKITDLSETIEAAVFNKKFEIVEDVGLVNVEYQLVIDDADLEEMCMLLYEQAKAYMPSPSEPLENLKSQQMVEWIESEKIDEVKSIPKSIVRVSFESEPYGYDKEKTLISINIFTNRALRDKLLND